MQDHESLSGNRQPRSALRSVLRLPVFDSLHSRDFRWFWVARLAHSASMEMGSVALGWLAYRLTGSALALGWVSSARSIARLILSLYGGALADRLQKRQVLIWARAAMGVNVPALAFLILSGAVQAWHLIAYSFLSGVISALMMPAQKAYLAQLVDRKTLLNAVSLTFASMGLMGVFGASAAGFLIDWVGAQAVYLIIAVFYAAAILALGRLPRDEVTHSGTTSVLSDLRQGLGYLKVQPIILPLLGLVVVRVILGWSYRTMLPVYASSVLQLGARGLGLLSAAPSIGSLLCSLALASVGDLEGKGKVLLVAGFVMGLSIAAFSNARHFALAFFFLLLVGAGRRGVIISSQTLIQVNTEPAYRGRIMATYMMGLGLVPLSTLPAGAMADAWGVPVALTLQGGLMAMVFVVVWLSRSKVRYLDLFSHIGVFSMGLQEGRDGGVNTDFEERNADFFADPAETNKRLKLFYIASGENDTIVTDGPRRLSETLKRHGIEHIYNETPGGHVWINWRLYLRDFAPLLFRE